jgi:flagellar export protein FliJ
MKAFRFRLESVLTLRHWEEERARTAYAQALQQERKFVDQLRAVEGRIEQDTVVMRRAAETTTPASDRVARWRHLLTLERERSDTTQKLASARRIREQKMKLLIDAHRRVETLGSLKTRHQQAHTAEAARREERELDELASARFQPDL